MTHKPPFPRTGENFTTLSKITSLPDGDARMKQWLGPLSAMCESPRADLNYGRGFNMSDKVRRQRIRDAKKGGRVVEARKVSRDG